MKAKQKLRMTFDITMTLFSITLMGGTMLFYDERVHQVLGMALLLLWAAHIALNRRWSPFKGSYPLCFGLSFYPCFACRGQSLHK